MANYQTGAQRKNAAYDKIWDQYKQQQTEKQKMRKKLFWKNGSYTPARADEDSTGKYICVYEHSEDEKLGALKYSVFAGRSAMRQTVIFAQPMEELPQYEILLMTEIIENFNQYFNNLNQ